MSSLTDSLGRGFTRRGASRVQTRPGTLRAEVSPFHLGVIRFFFGAVGVFSLMMILLMFAGIWVSWYEAQGIEEATQRLMQHTQELAQTASAM